MRCTAVNTIKFDKKNVKTVAHRGLSGLEKENTNGKVIMWENTSTEIKEMLIKIGCKYYCFTNKIEIIEV